MSREMIRQGGRSARIQEEVHQAVNALLQTTERSAITVPMVAERAGVTPSTIYRRWGDLAQLLADVAAAHMRPNAEPEDTGTLRGDVESFIQTYAEEMSTPVGRQMMTDVLAGSNGEAMPVKCCVYTYQHLDTLNARAAARGEAALNVDAAIDQLIAPVVYHILFGDRVPTPEYCQSLLTRFFAD